jgi:hypothetical protein
MAVVHHKAVISTIQQLSQVLVLVVVHPAVAYLVCLSLVWACPPWMASWEYCAQLRAVQAPMQVRVQQSMVAKTSILERSDLDMK